MFGKAFRLAGILMLLVIIGSCGRNKYKTMRMKPAKATHKWEKSYRRPRLWRGNGYW